jgi:tryptophan-rich sensory protein
MMRTLPTPLTFIITIVGTLVVGSLSGLLTADAIGTWYVGINKPSFNPPNWIFGPVWTVLYILMGIAAGLVWTSGAEPAAKRRALGIYLVQLVLNFGWSLIFFGLRSPVWAFVEIILLWAAIVWCMRSFGSIHRTAMLLLVPYLLWVSFATVLNGAIAALN